MKGWIAFWAFAFFTICAGFTLQHEMVHVRIYEGFGYGASVELSFNQRSMSVSGFELPNFGMRTVPSGLADLTEGERLEMKKLHLQNEIYGYNTQWVIAAVV